MCAFYIMLLYIISYFSTTTTTTIKRCRTLCWQSKVFPALGLGHDQKLARLDTWADFLHDHLQQIVQYICDSTVMSRERSLYSALVCYVYIHHDAHGFPVPVVLPTGLRKPGSRHISKCQRYMWILTVKKCNYDNSARQMTTESIYDSIIMRQQQMT